MSFVVRLVLRLAGAFGIFIAAIAASLAIIFAVYFGGYGLVSLIALAKDSPELGVPILTAIVVFCLYCAFIRKEKAAAPPKDVLRGPVVIRTEEQTFFVRPQSGSGEAQSEPSSSPSTVADDPWLPWKR